MSLRRTRAISPLSALPRVGNPGRARLLPSSRIYNAHTPTTSTTTRTLCNSPIRLNSHAKHDPTISSVSSVSSVSPASAVEGASDPNLSPEQVGELQSTDLLDVYNSLVARGLIVWDAEQVRCVMEVSRNLSLRHSLHSDRSSQDGDGHGHGAGARAEEED